MSSCTAIIQNNSGRSLDAVWMLHTSGEPEAPDLVNVGWGAATLSGKNVAPGTQLKQTNVELSWGSPTDYWTMWVLFSGDGTGYWMAGVLAAPYKEYEVSDGSTITFIINTYTPNTTDQSDITIKYSGDQGGYAHLCNPVTITWASPLGEIGKHLAVEAAL